MFLYRINKTKQKKKKNDDDDDEEEEEMKEDEPRTCTLWVANVTLVIGPAEDICVRCRVEVGLGLDLNAVIDWLTPSANMKFSLSSIFVLPLATVCCVHAVS